MWQNVTVRARAQSWFGQALASTSTNLYVIENGALTALRYCIGIHNKIVRPYLGAIGPEFILMGDNAGPHVHTSLLSFLNMRQSFVWTGLLNHQT